MAEAKFKPGTEDVITYIEKIDDEIKRDDSYTLIKLMKKLTKHEPVLWAGSIIAFGKVHYKYASGHEGDTCLAGFSPRKQQFSIYLTCDLQQYSDYLARLGKHKTGKGCLYVKRLSDINIDVLEEMIRKTVSDAKQ